MEKLFFKYYFLLIVVAVGIYAIVGDILIHNTDIVGEIQKKPQVLSENVEVTASVYGCHMDITARPEKRYMSNYSTILSVDIFDNLDNYIDTATVTTDVNGEGRIGLCDQGIYLDDVTNYNFYIRGYSHLRKVFANEAAFSTALTVKDFWQGNPNNYLLAGETSNIFDNKINSLDLSTQINKDIIFTNDYKNDLNQDGEVNSLDLSNTVFNFYKVGD